MLRVRSGKSLRARFLYARHEYCLTGVSPQRALIAGIV